MPRRLLPALLLALTGAAQAGVYTYLDADGNRVFTDQPPSGNAQRIELAPANAMTPPTVPAPPPYAPAGEPLAPVYSLLRILVPEPDATIRAQTGELIVSATSEPALQPGHRFRLILDGQPQGQPGSSPVFPLSNIDRGTHLLSVEIIDAEGRILERTPAQPFHMKRISLADKRRVRPCVKGDWGVRPECPLKDQPPEPRNIPYIPVL